MCWLQVKFYFYLKWIMQAAWFWMFRFALSTYVLIPTKLMLMRCSISSLGPVPENHKYFSRLSQWMERASCNSCPELAICSMKQPLPCKSSLVSPTCQLSSSCFTEQIHRDIQTNHKGISVLASNSFKFLWTYCMLRVPVLL